MITRKQPNRVPQQRAGVLLSAWHSGDRFQVEAALGQDSAGKGFFKARDSAHSERDEMVEAAEGAIRAWLRNPTPEAELDLQVSLRLLSHLASREFSSASA